MIVKVRPISTSLNKGYRYPRTLQYRSGRVPVEVGMYVVVPFGVRRKLGVVTEVARSRRALSGRAYPGDLKTIDREATATEKRLVKEIEAARLTKKRAAARILKKGRVLEQLIR